MVPGSGGPVWLFLKQHLSQKDKLVVCDTANLDEHSDSIANLLKCFYILVFQTTPLCIRCNSCSISFILKCPFKIVQVLKINLMYVIIL